MNKILGMLKKQIDTLLEENNLVIGCLFITEKLDRIHFINDTFHNLSIMLQYILDRTTVVRPPDEIIWLQGYFQSLTDFDRESDSFRYPFHIKTNRDALGE